MAPVPFSRTEAYIVKLYLIAFGVLVGTYAAVGLSTAALVFVFYVIRLVW